MVMRRVALLTIAAAVSAYAHHSLHGTYLMEQQVSVEGKVAKFLLRNPHSFIEIEVPQEDGPAQTWDVEWGTGGQLAARGIRWDTVKPGDEVTVTMSPARNSGSHRGLLRIIRRPSDGFEWGTKPGEEPAEWRVETK